MNRTPTRPRKLTLGRETLRRLEPRQLDRIAGGATRRCDPKPTMTCSCTACFCETTILETL